MKSRFLFAMLICIAGTMLTPELSAQVKYFNGKRIPTPFTDRTFPEGIDFVHEFPNGDIMFMGAGAAFGDYDGDGWHDIFMAQRIGSNAMYQNMQGNGFVDVAPILGLEDPDGEGTGGLFGDYDNDGDHDLYIMNRGGNLMFRNDGGLFTDVTATCDVAGFARTAAAAYADYDDDGFLDLYVANHSYEFDKPVPGAPWHTDVLYHNVDSLGERVFTDVTATYLDQAVLDISIAHGVAWFDYDLDGDLDLYVVNESMKTSDPALTGENLMYRNDGSDGNGGWIFTEVAALIGAGLRGHPMGIAVGDYNNDGWWDFVMSDLGANTLFQNDGGTFTERAEEAGVDRPAVPDGSQQVSWGAVFFDYDFDGYEDMYIAAGTLGNRDNQPNTLFRNNRDGPDSTFSLMPGGAETPLRSRTVIKCDYDLDGDEDMVVMNLDEPAQLYRNERDKGHFLGVRCIGTVSNRDAIGTRLTANVAGQPDQYRFVQNGFTTGGNNDLLVTFGFKNNTAQIDTLTIDWPSGLQTVLTNVALDQVITVTE